MDAADFKPDNENSPDLPSCLGAGWIFGGRARTLEALETMPKPGSWVIVEEPYRRREPSEEYIEVSGARGAILESTPRMLKPKSGAQWN
ncbi:MAG: hypothetical protein WHS46_04900 [Desulfosoma sp.]